ncbi:MAG: phosphatase PAP2 family protein [Acidimicrobiia bacterium]|nr:phosphatase PAP2 family protein [Acidimicrobiia bacterium]
MLEAISATAERIDDVVDDAWDALRGRPIVDRIFYTASELADFSLVWHLIGTGRALIPPASPMTAIRLSAALGVESILVNGIIKSVFKRERPVAGHARPLHLRLPRTTSFPSGHASSAFLAATLLAEGTPRRSWAYYGLAGLVATSRVHVRIHHASDVAAGAALGLALGQIVKRVRPLR